MTSSGAWRRCASCKTDIAFETIHQVCSVSTCNRKRTGLVFCSVSCWDAHLPIARHREAWAVEAKSPSRAEFERSQEPVAEKPREPRRILARPEATAAAPEGNVPREILIVVSKLKAYVKARSGMNTSDRVMSALSEHVRALCDEAIESARRNERRTVLDRDFKPPRR